ncbi:(deoxy)nucleoside triphosphate pyrophosphohydrolase [Erysipelothrix urinaevulpis]|uniref:(deoxy)nucleoside triphosphate pyrophosphohydrolase n=1 Tax=Erysipelothrix urinaevulpis TaxID=2683717 RepID=UPI0013583C53|nr:(deoxy)nucleoside triphosphate pyrophosphohydrolase [Erysipelothrix urinaevulpis]
MKRIEVSAAVILQDDKILVTKRIGEEFDGQWEFPGGKVEAGETHEETVIREIKEELSVDIKVNQYFDTITYQYDSFHLTMHLFFCEIKYGELVLNEHSDAKWLMIDELSGLDWVPADIQIVDLLKNSKYLKERKENRILVF